MRTTLRLLVLLTFAVLGFAADVAGKWKGSAEGPDGAIEIEFTFKNDGGKITGTATGPMGDAPITDVQLEGDKISFTVEAGDMKIVHKGEVSGNEMKLKVGMGDRTMNMTAQRSGS